MEVIKKQGQWLGDLAIRQSGSFEAIFDMAVINDVPITEPIDGGQPIAISTDAIDGRVINYLARNNVTPASDLEPPKPGIGYWAIEIDFVVS